MREIVADEAPKRGRSPLRRRAMKLGFSRRTAWNLAPNAFTARVADARARGRVLVDLTESNPTRCGICETSALVSLLGDPRGAAYAPDPLGERSARAAIVDYYSAHDATIDVDRIVCSASTSEAYGWLFKLLCDRDDAVLVPRPSYPLFDYLAALEDVRLVPYPLLREENFRVDLDALEGAVEPTTRAILVVHPNNPTGSFVRREDAAAIEAIAERHGLAVVVDEVFLDYAHGPLSADRLGSFASKSFDTNRRALTFVMSGLSKVVALPQAKLGWTLALGPEDLAREAMARLEMIADTYLSVGTPIQRALPEILAARAPIQSAIRARIGANLRAIDACIVADSPSRRLPCDGGWYAILEVPRTRDDDAWVDLLLEEESVIVHPGYFFDLPEGSLVVSLLPEPSAFADAIARVIARTYR